MPQDQRPRRTLPRATRIRSRSDFERAFQEKKRAADAVMTLYLRRNDSDLARLGIAAGRRLGHAVARNRIKRLIREVFRLHRAELPPGSDWVAVPRNAACTFDNVERSFLQLSRRLLQTDRCRNR